MMAKPPKPAPDAMREALKLIERTCHTRAATIARDALRSVEQTGSTAPVPSPDGAAVESAAKYLDDLEGGMLARDADTPSQVAEKLRASTPPPDDVRSALAKEITIYLKDGPILPGSPSYTLLYRSVAALRSPTVSAPTREALIEEFSHFPNREGVGRHVAIVDWFLERFTAPTVGTTREQYARAVCEIDGYDYDRERRLAQNGEMSAREIINRAHRYADAILAISAPATNDEALTYDEKVEMLRLADDIAGAEIADLDTAKCQIVTRALRIAGDLAAAPAVGVTREAMKEYRLLADRLRWIYEQRSIDLPLAGEVLRRLPEIISGLDALVASPAPDATVSEPFAWAWRSSDDAKWNVSFEEPKLLVSPHGRESLVVKSLYTSPQDVGREATVRPVSAETLAQLMPSGKWTCPRCNTTHPVLARDAGADAMIGQIEERFPDWKSYRDLVDCIDVTLHNLRSRQ